MTLLESVTDFAGSVTTAQVVGSVAALSAISFAALAVASAVPQKRALRGAMCDLSNFTLDAAIPSDVNDHGGPPLLPSVVERLTDIHYHRSSPYSGFGKVTTDKNYGDLHQCKGLLPHVVAL